jgi:phosphate transport system protein
MPSSIKRTALDSDLAAITFSLRRLGEYVDLQTEAAVAALQSRDSDLAAKVVAQDERVNKLRYEIERQCLDTIALQQPAAHDLRRVIAALHMAVELERMGDHAGAIASIAQRLEPSSRIGSLPDFDHMRELACEMIRLAVQAFAAADIAIAGQVLQRDTDMDALYVQALRVQLTYMMQDPALVTEANNLLWVAHHLERIGDRATNLAERVIFSEGGELGDYMPEQFPPPLE